MRFIHTSDLHLGVTPDAGAEYTKRRPEEIWDSFRKLLIRCETEHIDLLLIAGDVFHRQPLMRELKELNSMFEGLSHTKVVLIAGNHDYLKPNSLYRNFPWAKNVVPLLGSRLMKVEFPELRTAVSGFSYQEREMTGGIRVEWKCVRSMENEIMLLHGGDETHISFKRAEVDLLGYDYTALGHIHKADMTMTGKCRYSGALEPTDPNDTGRHGYVLGTMENGIVETEFVPAAQREYLHLNICVDREMTGHRLLELMKEKIRENGEENMYRFTLEGLRDPDIRFDPEYMDVGGGIVDIRDLTKPAYDFEKIASVNEQNLLGRFIRSFPQQGEISEVEQMALYEGVQAILETRKE